MSEGSAAAAQRGKVSWEELSKHNKAEDMWLLIHGKVYDLTEFANEHPGGKQVLLQQAGKDATSAFGVIHSKDVLDMLEKTCELGDIDGEALQQEITKEELLQKVKDIDMEERKPPLEQMLNTLDFESVARGSMTPEGWAYYSSGSDDEITLRENHSAFQRIWLKPRVLINVKEIDMTTSMYGTKVSFPLYVTATALGKLAHPTGEVGIVQGATRENVIYMLPTLASSSLDDMLAARTDKSMNWMQLYVNADRKRTLAIIKKAEKAGCEALCITVDAPMLGRRERDMRHKFTSSESSAQKGDNINRNQVSTSSGKQHDNENVQIAIASKPTASTQAEKGIATDSRGANHFASRGYKYEPDRNGVTRAISSFIDPSLSWKDLEWFKKNTTMKICLKGVQCREDAILAAKAGVDGMICSNHGGRQVDGARSGIEILPEVMDGLRSVGADKKIEVYVDGGIRRGSDLFKAVALGARGVGIGRPTLWGLAGYGADGVAKVLSLLKEELAMMMTLMGTPTIKDICANHVITSSLHQHIVPVPQDYLVHNSYIPMQPAGLARSKL